MVLHLPKTSNKEATTAHRYFLLHHHFSRCIKSSRSEVFSEKADIKNFGKM